MNGEPDPFVEVHLLRLPLAIWSETQEHMDELLREFTLLQAGEANPKDHPAPRRLLELVAELQADYAGVASDQEEQLAAAAEAGERSLDLTYRVPVGVGDACRRLEAALDEADRYCREGDYLLTLATPPASAAFRRWFLGQFVDQIDGKPPRSWDDWGPPD